MRAARSIHRIILRLAPRAFRLRYAEEADQAFARLLAERRRRSGVLAAVALVFAACLDALRTVVRERRRAAEAPALAGLGPEFRSAIRVIRRRPSYAAAVILTIGLSAGVLAAVFAFVDPMLWRPLPIAESDRVVVGNAEGARVVLNQLQKADYFRLLEPTASFEAVGSFYSAGIGEIEGLAMDLGIHAVTPGFMAAMRLAPAMGRTFRAEEYLVQPPPVMLITHDVWREAFSLRPDVVGAQVTFRGYSGRRTYEVIGVLPRGFIMPTTSASRAAGLVPGEIGRANTTDWRARTPIVARLRPGVSLELAEQELRVLAAETERAYPTLPQHRTVTLLPVREVWFGDVRSIALLLFAGAAAVLLVAAVNLAHLIKSRLRVRERELAVRTAIGASRARLMRLLACEILALAAAGSLLALIVGRLGLVAIADAMPYYQASYRRIPPSFDTRVVIVLVTAIAIMAAAIYFWMIARLLRGPLPELGSSRATGRRRSELVFVFTQSAIGMGLVVCSAQVSASLFHMTSAMGTFADRDLQMLSVNWSGRRPQGIDMHDLQRRSAEAVREQFPGRIAAFTAMPGGAVSVGAVRRAGAAPGRGRPVEAAAATADAFELLGIRLLAGRLYTAGEVWSDAPVAVADRRAADLLWPGENPIGKRIADDTDDDQPREREIIGLVDEFKVVRPPGAFHKGLVFTPFSRTRQATFNFLYRLDDGAPPLADVRRAFARVDPDVLMAAYPYLPNERQMGQVRFVSVVLLTLTALTLVLAAVGLFGMISHAVTSRAREIAIRLALGAMPSTVKRAIVGHHLLAVALGIGLGAALALRAATALEAVRFDVRPDDGGSYLGAAILLLVVVLVASYMPARRAARIDPAITLKAE